MKKILYILFALSLLAGCDYNEEYFDGYDDIVIADAVQYEGVFTGVYPSDGYFSDRTAVENAVNAMLKSIYKYCDEGSTAKVSNILYAEVTPGFSAADVTYTLVDDDYIAMGTESGQPGKYKNFDANMDVVSYLIAFCTSKYASLAEGETVSIVYKFYASGTGTTNQTKSFEKAGSTWTEIQLAVFTTDYTYTMVEEDYIAMGTASGQPGRYKNFDANMDINHYISIMLKGKYPYAVANATASVTYAYFASGATTNPSRIYKYDGTSWSFFDPYASTTDITEKVAEMIYDGTDWKLKRLLGGTFKFTMAEADYRKVLDWVKATKAPEYISTTNPDEEYYTGCSARYFNVNNNYNTWRNYYGKLDTYPTDNTAMQAIMDARIAEAIVEVLLPSWVSTPDPGVAYIITYKIYSGRGDGFYHQTFMYNEEPGKYEVTEGVVKE